MVTEIRTVVTSEKVIVTGKRHERPFRDAGNVLDFYFTGSFIDIYTCTNALTCTSKIGAL